MAAEISAQLVRELREQTGAGMMDCKRALQETNGDIEAAVVLLREKGMANAAKRADRATTEGLVGYRLADDGSRGTMVAVGCETEPVSKNEEFQAFGKKVLDAVEAEGIERRRPARRGAGRSCPASSARTSPSPARLASRPSRADASARTSTRRRTSSASSCSCAAATTSSARNLAMHISWSDPRWIGREDVPDDLVAAEREIYLNSDEVQSKPEQAREKIVDGMLEQALLRRAGRRARRPAVDPRRLADGRQGARRRGSRGARVRALLARGMTAQPETETGPRPSVPAFRRVLLKLSGEALMGEREYGIDPDVTRRSRRRSPASAARASTSRSSSAAGTSTAASPRRPRAGWTARPPTTPGCSRRSSTRSRCRTRSSGRAPTRASCPRSRSRRSRSRTSAAARSATSRRAAS